MSLSPLFASLFLLFPRNAWYSGYACEVCQVKIVPRFFFSLVSSYALEIGKIGEGSFKGSIDLGEGRKLDNGGEDDDDGDDDDDMMIIWFSSTLVWGWKYKYLSFGQRDDIILQQSTWTSTVLTKNQTADFRDGILMSSPGEGCKNIAEQGLRLWVVEVIQPKMPVGVSNDNRAMPLTFGCWGSRERARKTFVNAPSSFTFANSFL